MVLTKSRSGLSLSSLSRRRISASMLSLMASLHAYVDNDHCSKAMNKANDTCSVFIPPVVSKIMNTV